MPTLRRLLLLPLAAAVTATGLVSLAPSAGAATTDVRINEVESNGDATDWIELYNTGAASVDISGWIVKDDNDSRTLAVPAGTTIAAGGFYTVDTDLTAPTPNPSFGLGAADKARIYLPNGTTLVDSYSWSTHAATTYGRCPDGTGAFTTTAASTKNASNACAPVTAPSVTAWPGGQSVRTVDQAALTTENLSGLTYQGSGTSAPGTLWAVKNGNASTLFKLQKSGDSWVSAPGDWAAGKNLDYTDGLGEPDAEGVTLTDAGPSGGFFVATERNNDANTVSRPAIERYDDVEAAGTKLTATRDYDLSADLPGLGANLGLEAITWVPDSALVASGFTTTAGTVYDPAAYPNHGTGLFLVGVEQNGQVIAYALSQDSNAATRVAAFNSGFPAIMELTWEPQTQQLWAVCDNTCQGRSSRLAVDTRTGSATKGQFVATATYERPTAMGNLNNEGFAIAPASECSTTASTKPVFWADDGDTDGFSLREGTLSCGTPPTTTTPPTGPGATTPTTPPAVDRTAPSVRVAGVRNGGVYRNRAPRPRCRATDAVGVTRCTVTKRTKPVARGLRLVVATATAVDAAGNTAVATKTYVARR